MVGVLALALIVGLPTGYWLVTSGPSGGVPGPGSGVGGTAVIVAPAVLPGTTATDLGPVAAKQSMTVALEVAPRDPAGLSARIALEYAAGSSEYHRFLTPSALAETYGADPGAYAAAARYLGSFGLGVRTSPDHLLLIASGPATAVASAFHTSFERYRIDGREVFSHPTAATLPSSIPWAGVVGLGNVSPPRPALASAGPQVSTLLGPCGSSSPYAPCAISVAYNSSGLLATGTNGSGYRIGVVDTYDGSESQSTLTSDLASFASANGFAVGTVHYLYPVPTGRNLNLTSTGWGLEEALDLEWSRAMAPGATVDMTFAPDASAGLYAAVDWLVAHQAVDILSLSWGEPDTGTYNSWQGTCSTACNASSDGSYQLLHPVLADAIAEGIGVFAASGDCGAADGTNGVATSYPASDPASTGVGATDLTLRNGTYSSESGWSGNASGVASPGCSNQGGSGGGFSPFPRPAWQSGPGVPTTPASRAVPDVAVVGGSPISLIYNGISTSVWGTSAGAPIWAGFEAIADQYAGAALGSLSPSLYQIAASPSAAASLHDVTSGWNGYSAGTGWDPVTGLGSPNVGHLVPLLRAVPGGVSNLTVTLAANPRIGSAPLAASFYVGAAGGTGSYPVLDVDFGDGNASLAAGGRVSHTYPRSGVYVARAVAFDSAGNSSVSTPVAVVVGGAALGVTLNASRTTVPPGQTVTLTASVSGGSTPYTFWFTFGDGTYLDGTNLSKVAHTYPIDGGFCAAVVAADGRSPPDGGVSDPVPITVGAAPAPSCPHPAPLVANLTSAVTVADVPGDLPLNVTTSGGTPPVTVRYVSDDPYVAACDCGIFHTAGNHTVTAFVNDSLNQETVATLNVTIRPALEGVFTHSALSGPSPLTVDFSVLALGGDAPNANSTQWTFGDGASATGSNVSHSYLTAGTFLALAELTDAAGGVTSAAFLVDAVGALASPGIVLSAAVTPATQVPAGTLVTFSASASGGVGPYLYRWDLGDNDSGFGPTLQQTFPEAPCLASGSCPLSVTLRALDANGTTASVGFTLPSPVRGRYSAISLAETVSPLAGTTPLHVSATANASGVPGLSYAWTFGDGAGTVGPAVAHTYFTPGNYTLELIVGDPWGDRLVRTEAMNVSGPPRQPPSILGGPNLSAGLAPLLVGFSVNGSGGLGPYTFAWEFGDGGSGSGAQVAHTYTVPGRYNATVLLTDGFGSTNRTTYPIVAYARTVVALAAQVDRSSVAEGGTVRLSLWATVDCTGLSAPPCEPTAFTVAFDFRPAAGGPTVAAGAATPGVAGGLIVTLPVPALPGTYLLNATVLGTAYAGSVQLPVTVTPPPLTDLLLPFALPPWVVLATGVAVGVLAPGLVLRALGRPGRGASPSRPRAAEGGRRGG